MLVEIIQNGSWLRLHEGLGHLASLESAEHIGVSRAIQVYSAVRIQVIVLGIVGCAYLPNAVRRSGWSKAEAIRSTSDLERPR